MNTVCFSPPPFFFSLENRVTYVHLHTATRLRPSGHTLSRWAFFGPERFTLSMHARGRLFRNRGGPSLEEMEVGEADFLSLSLTEFLCVRGS